METTKSTKTLCVHCGLNIHGPASQAWAVTVHYACWPAFVGMVYRRLEALRAYGVIGADGRVVADPAQLAAGPQMEGRPMSDATTDSRCGTCAWWDRARAVSRGGEDWARCRYAPLPAWARSSAGPITGRSEGERCEAWLRDGTLPKQEG